MAQQHEILRTVIKSRGGGVMSLILENEPTHRIDLYMTPHPDRVHSSFCLNGQFLALFDLTIDLRIVLADGVRYRMLKDRGGPSKPCGGIKAWHTEITALAKSESGSGPQAASSE